MKKNKIDGDLGRGAIDKPGKVTAKRPAVCRRRPKGVLGPGTYPAKHIIVATGARPRALPGMEPDGKLDLDLFRGDEA